MVYESPVMKYGSLVGPEWPAPERWLIYGYVHEGTAKEFVMRKIAGENWVVGCGRGVYAACRVGLFFFPLFLSFKATTHGGKKRRKGAVLKRGWGEKLMHLLHGVLPLKLVLCFILCSFLLLCLKVTTHTRRKREKRTCETCATLSGCFVRVVSFIMFIFATLS